MDDNNAVNNKQRVRGRSRQRWSEGRSPARSTVDTVDEPYLNDVNGPDNTISVRVKERDSDISRRGIIGGIFKETPGTAIKEFFNKEPTQELKETIKRPLSGLFKRPSSLSGPVPQKKEGKPNSGSASDSTTNICPNKGCEAQFSPDVPTFSAERQIMGDGAAKAPNIDVHRVAAMYQLDVMNMKNAHLMKLDEIDISLLSRYLCAEDEVKDENAPWTWDYLFASISSEMRDEWAMEDEVDYDAYDGNRQST
ncbi:hypothetical protein AB6A40_002073 [Gnathostoma spinigerum]|uniref:Uncharacterized protein n=1 Tax=Gnathostoma spinigerum TaxID=75299 RepID=A0ABD6EDF1_9BILA